jgi:very-short-patch-repair endonuclease
MIKYFDKFTTKYFISRARKIHGNKYDYSRTIYKKAVEKVCIICKKHGKFWQKPNDHLTGYGCPGCYNENRGKSVKLNTSIFIKRAKKIHGNKYGYSLVNYQGCRVKVLIRCKKHKFFFSQTPSSHINLHQGCPKCGYEKTSKFFADTTNIFIKKAKKIHKNDYDYRLVIYKGSETKVKIICKKCKKVFEQRPVIHLVGSGCPICHLSKGEIVIRHFLEKNKIKFKTQKRFKDCKNTYTLPFDFYLPEYNLLIEFDGKQHFQPTDFTSKMPQEQLQKNFRITQQNDKIKNNYCKKKHIKLIRISYKLLRHKSEKFIVTKLKTIFNIK